MEFLRKSLTEGSCLLNLQASNIEEVIRASADFLVQTGRLPEAQRETVIAGLVAREKIVPTAIGNACALPHFYNDAIEAPIMVFIRLKRAANFGAPDGIATRFIFLLLGPTDRAGEHLDVLATIARLMSDREFHYEASRASTQQALISALDQHLLRMQSTIPVKPREITEGLKSTGIPFDGIVRDLKRRLPHYLSDFTDGFDRKCLASVLFLFFACLAPAVTFGGIMGLGTEGQIGAVEMLVATAACGVVYSLLAGQPLIILGGIGPLLIFTVILYRLCGDFELQNQFLGVYGWVGLWTGGFTMLLAVTNASNLMRHFTRFTDEIFSALMSAIFIYEALKAIVNTFRTSFADAQASHDTAFLTLLLSLGTFYIAMTLSRFRKSHYLLPWMREFLADFGPSIALFCMAIVAFWLRDEVSLKTLVVGSGFGTTTGRPWLVDLGSVPTWIRFAAAGPAALATVLVYLSQNITARLVNNPENKLSKGESYHLDLGVVGLLIGACSFFGFPWLCAATVRSLAHMRALADVEEVVSRGGSSKDRIIHVTENRVTALAIHLLIAGTLFVLPLLRYLPMATLYGIFLYMGVVSLQGMQFMERLSLWVMDSSLYPATHYIRRVPIRVIHLFTLVQFVCLAVLCVINVIPSEPVRILFPVFIALLIPIRWLMDRFFAEEHLAILDADEEPEDEQSHWF